MITIIIFFFLNWNPRFVAQIFVVTLTLKWLIKNFISGFYKSRWSSNLQSLLTENMLYQNQPESLNLISESASMPPKLTKIKHEPKVKQRKSSSLKDSPISNRVLIVQQEKFSCQNCERVYKNKDSLGRHLKWECGKEPSFACSRCPYKARYKADLVRHEKTRHLKREQANNSFTGDVY